MSTNTIIENIFRELISVIGHEKAVEIVESTKTTVVEKPKKSTKKTVAKETVVADTKRITRMSPTLAKQLTTELASAGMKFNDDNKKDFDKMKKDFVSYIDELAEDDFTAKSLSDHMKDFANLKKPAEKEDEVEKEKEVVVAVKKTRTTKKKADSAAALVPPTNPDDIVELSSDELKKLEMVAFPDNGPAGVMWDGENGRWVTGPAVDEDEDLVEVVFNKETYNVGELTHRVYKDVNNRDVFCGFAGIGVYKNIPLK
jgi:hypothetical protein